MNFRAGVEERLGIDYETLKKINPKIISCSITGFGSSGPLRDRPGFETVFQAISLGDVMEIELTSAGVEIFCNNPAIPTDESNLAYKAFLGLSGLIKYEGGVRIKIRKTVPPGSGIGGGSSNAAATLVSLNRLLKAGLEEEQLRDVAKGIGADVPFFISGGLAAGWGIGDKIERLTPLVESSIVVAIHDNVAVSTAEAYSTLAAPECKESEPAEFSECSERLKDHVKALDPRRSLWENNAAAPFLHNSLEKPIFARHPEISALKSLLLNEGAKGALMSGSGSAVFGLAESPEHAQSIRSAIEKSPNCTCFLAQTVSSGWEWNA